LTIAYTTVYNAYYVRTGLQIPFLTDAFIHAPRVKIVTGSHHRLGY